MKVFLRPIIVSVEWVDRTVDWIRIHWPIDLMYFSVIEIIAPHCNGASFVLICKRDPCASVVLLLKTKRYSGETCFDVNHRCTSSLVECWLITPARSLIRTASSCCNSSTRCNTEKNRNPWARLEDPANAQDEVSSLFCRWDGLGGRKELTDLVIRWMIADEIPFCHFEDES